MRTSLRPAGGLGKTPAETGIRQALPPEETLLWQGRPAEGVHVHVSMETVAFLLIGMTMLIVSIVFFAGMLAAGIPTVFLIIPAPFFLVGVIFLMFVIGYPFMEAKRLAKFQYAVTNRRILVQGPKSLSVYQIRELAGLGVKCYKDGSGTIYMERKTIRGWKRRYILEEIPDAERVYQLIERQMAEI